MESKIHPIARLWNLVKEERTDILAIYFFAILNGLLQLSLPLGIQGIMGFVIGGIFSASLILLTILVTGSVLLSGFMQINQMRIIERIQQRIFAKYSF
ncbi:MAG TPA: hypothetical protein PL045_10760, partial [Chitinophagaceae bacterium]|nr:hypothetical protein [Chitinophagaceae bacterium]